MTTFDPRLLIPPEEDEEVYPYRRVWRSIIIEAGLLFSLTLGLFVAFNLLGLSIPTEVQPTITLGLAILPLAIWVLFSWLAERRVPQPRSQLHIVLLLSALAANAIGVPLIDQFFQVDRWLPLSSAINRIIGYTFTMGVVQELLKYAVARYTIWPQNLRTRLDTVAYSAAGAIGYATVLNLHFALNSSVTPDVAANRIFGTVALHLATSIIVAYGLSMVRFGEPPVFLLTLTLAAAAFVTGVAIPVRAGLVNAALGFGVSAGRPLQGIIFSAALLAVVILVFIFLFSSADREDREVERGQERR